MKIYLIYIALLIFIVGLSWVATTDFKHRRADQISGCKEHGYIYFRYIHKNNDCYLEYTKQQMETDKECETPKFWNDGI